MSFSLSFCERVKYEAVNQVPTNDWQAVFRTDDDFLSTERCVSMGDVRHTRMRAPVFDDKPEWNLEKEVFSSIEFGGRFRQDGYGICLADGMEDFVGYVRVGEDPYVVLAREIETLHGDFLCCRSASPSTATVPAWLR
ncbi:MAG: hypothetical protein O3B13_14540 [Planctomycetota bacterium]|nr:hypothetical protein [Planctomycetota bacterium]